jgi:hypothetical protein
MARRIAAILFLCVTPGNCGHSQAATYGPWGAPEPVTVEGYEGHVMEPFVSCAGDVLLFNNRNQPQDQTDLHWATKVTDARFEYRGPVGGVNTQALEGVPSMDCAGNLYFVSPRAYDKTLATIYTATFRDGMATGVRLVPGVSRQERGIVNFDAEIGPQGQELYVVDGRFSALGGPHTADIVLAVRQDGGFVRRKDNAALFARVNTPALEYAPAISHDGLELFFTRVNGSWFWRYLTIEHATRATRDQPWGAPVPIKTITGFVEAPATSASGTILYFHKDVDGRFQLFLVRRRKDLN